MDYTYCSQKKFLIQNLSFKDNEQDKDKMKIFPNDDDKKDKLENDIKKEINEEFFALLQKDKFDDEDSEKVRRFIKDYIKKHKYFFQDNKDYELFVDMIVNDIFGLGVLENYINDKDINEIWVLNKDNIFLDRKGVREKSPLKFKNNKVIVSMINKILAPINRKADESTPTVDATLEDGSRVAITMPPVALDGPEVVIRKFIKEKFALDEYVHHGSCTTKMAKFLSNSVKWGANILVVGGTSSGKTTLLNALGNEIPQDRGQEHVITIEDSAELMVHTPFLQRWETKNKNAEGKGEVTPSALVKHSLRNSPDRIWLGETRDAVAYDVLQAASTGHKGTMTTIHADDAAKAVQRFSTLAASAGIIDADSARELFAQTFDLIVVMSRVQLKNGENKRVIAQITHIVGSGDIAAEKIGVKPVKDPAHVYLKDIYNYNKTTEKFRCTGYMPNDLIKKAKAENREYDPTLFEKD